MSPLQKTISSNQMENNPFDVFYFDGQSAKRHDAHLRILPNSWEILLKESNETVIWELDGIHGSEMIANLLLFKYGEFPYQGIEAPNHALISILEKYYPKKSFFKKEYRWLHNQGLSIVLVMLVGLLGLAFAAYKYALPVVAEKAAEHFPEEYEIALGEKMYENIVDGGDLSLGKMTILDKKSKFINEFAQKIDFQTNYPIKISVVQSDTINAFALPGGRIVVFTGLLDKLQTKEQLAALLGHEVAHVSSKHSLKNIFRSLSGYLFISLITTDINAITGVILENANAIHNLGFSRELESEADTKSVELLKRNHLCTKGLVELLEVLDKNSPEHPIQLLSTHPLTKERIRFAKSQTQKDEPCNNNQPLEDIWKQIKTD